MGPELGSKSVRRCSGTRIHGFHHDRAGFIDVVRSVFKGFEPLNWRQLGRSSCSDTTFMDTYQSTSFAIFLFMSVGLAFATYLLSIIFGFLYTVALKLLEQPAVIIVSVFIVSTYRPHCRSLCHSGTLFERSITTSTRPRRDRAPLIIKNLVGNRSPINCTLGKAWVWDLRSVLP